MITAEPAPKGVRTFAIIWCGQLVSLLGSGISRFGIGVWVFERTGSVMDFALIFLSASLPAILLSPLAGVLVDRFDRRLILLASDGVAALASLGLLLLATADSLALWHIYALNVIGAAADAFQAPAFIASTTLLVPRHHLARASGGVQAGVSVTRIGAPLAAGALLAPLGLEGLLVLDLVTFACAALTLLTVHIPRPRESAVGRAARGRFLAEAAFGWRYIRQRPGLLALLLLFAAANFANGAITVLIPPLVLTFSSAEVLGRVQAAASAGMLAGSVLITAWGGPERRVRGILLWMAAGSGVLLLAGLRSEAALIALGSFGFLFMLPIANALSQAIWQRKVEPDLQGRVFATRRMVATVTLPAAYFLIGPLADHLFEPWMQPGGTLAGSAGALLGVGPGRGMGLMIEVIGLSLLALLAFFWRRPRLRDVESELPDAVDAPPAEADAAGHQEPR